MALNIDFDTTRGEARPFGLAHSTRWRGGLLLASMCAVAAASMVSAPLSSSTDADLVNLMRGMAALKALLVLAAYAVVHWRMGRVISLPVAAGYVAGIAVMAAGVVMIWRLAFFAETAVAFRLAMIGLLLLAMKDDDLVRLRPRRR